jgi:hypothetical protein
MRENENALMETFSIELPERGTGFNSASAERPITLNDAAAANEMADAFLRNWRRLVG